MLNAEGGMDPFWIFLILVVSAGALVIFIAYLGKKF